jgi:hypothetical protein
MRVSSALGTNATCSRVRFSDVEAFLHRHGDAGERQVGALRYGPVDLLCLITCAIEIAHDHRIDRSIQRFDPGDRRVGQLQSADGFRADSRSLLIRARIREYVSRLLHLFWPSSAKGSAFCA